MGKATWAFSGLFGVVGLALLFAAGVTIRGQLAFRADARTVPGQVVALDASKPVVEFRDHTGTPYRVRGSIASNPPAFEVGEEVSVRYRTGEPDQARIDGFLETWFASTVLGGLGSVFGGIGLGVGFWRFRKQRNAAWLRQSGTRIEARFTGVHLDTTLTINRRHPWRLTAQWQDPVSGQIHSFESDMLFFDPTEYVQREKLDVWVDPANPRRYHVDMDFLPGQAGD